MRDKPEMPAPPELEPNPLQPQEEKLVLPDYDNWKYQTASRSTPAIPLRTEQLMRRETTASPKEPLAKLRYLWNQDPAYKVLMIAIGTVLIASIIFISLISTTLLRNLNFFAQDSSYSQSAPTAVIPTGTVDLHPKFPTPSGGQGSGSSSQPPLQSTPILQSTASSMPTVQPSPTSNSAGTLTLQITNIPSRVMNNSVVNVSVNTNQPNVIVTLYIIYNAPPFRSYAGPRTTDDSGNATIPWNVSVFKIGNARAYVLAVARDTNGQRVQSQPVTVQIIGFIGG